MPGAQGPAGPPGTGAPGPQGPAGPPGLGAYGEDEWGFAGFTVATYSGNTGGRIGAHAACASEFAGAHLCHASEYILSVSSAAVPAAGAWLDPSATPNNTSVVGGAPSAGRYVSNNACVHWTTNNANNSGTYITDGGAVYTGGPCNALRTLACCNSASKIDFAGYTSATAVMAGRTAMHAACSGEFPGAHMCHAAEYVRSNSSDPVPADGAWLDPSMAIDGTSTVSGAPVFGRYVSSNACVHWTTNNANNSGTYITAGGAVYTGGPCNAPRRIACCFD